MNIEPEKYQTIIFEIEATLPNSVWKEELKHAQGALKWLLKMEPDADDDIKIATLSHDIDRAYESEKKDLKNIANSRVKYADFKNEHAQKAGQVISEILKKHDCEKVFVDRVRELVEKHEVGGGREADLVCDADSISYFDTIIDSFFKDAGLERTKNKIDFMFDRASDRAKETIKSLKYKNPVLEEYIKGK